MCMTLFAAYHQSHFRLFLLSSSEVVMSLTGCREELQYDFDSQFERFKVVLPCTAMICPLSLLEDSVTLCFK